MAQLIRQNRLYFILLFLYLITTGILLLTIEKGDEVIFLNQLHNTFFDNFFSYITYLGDGWFLAPLILTIVLFINKAEGIILTLSVLSTFLTIQFLKRIVFSGTLRPSTYLLDKVNLYFVPGIEIHGYNSFPSGHSGQAFAIATVLTLFTKNKHLSFLYLALAVLTALSRVYLAQHFLIDTLAGGLIGSLFGITIYYFALNLPIVANPKFQKGLFH